MMLEKLWDILGKLWNVAIVLSLAAAAIAFVTGKDFTGTPTSTTFMECSYIANEFVGDEIESDYMLRKILKIEQLEVLEKTSKSLTCRGLAFLDGSPSTYVRLSSVETSSGWFDLEVVQALPQDYTCDILADEIVMKFSREKDGNLGTLLEIANPKGKPDGGSIQCRGAARFSGGMTLNINYAYDGSEFSWNALSLRN